MANALTGIDHVVLAVADLERAARLVERLGFAVTPAGHDADDGTACRYLMFAEGAVELVAAEGEGPGAERVRAHLAAHGEGPMAIALGSRDVARSREKLCRAGLALGTERPQSHRLESDGETVCLDCRVLGLPAEATPGLPSFLCQPTAPDRWRRPAWLAHPNGARGIVSVTAVAPAPESLIPAYDRVFGALSSTPTDDMVTVHTGASLIFLVTPDGFDHLHPYLDLGSPLRPGIVALVVAVGDLDATAALLAANGVASTHRGDHVAVDPAFNLGLGLEFVAA